eukprot:6046252-Alexandrium_andersonii.AAC.1
MCRQRDKDLHPISFVALTLSLSWHSVEERAGASESSAQLAEAEGQRETWQGLQTGTVVGLLSYDHLYAPPF